MSFKIVRWKSLKDVGSMLWAAHITWMRRPPPSWRGWRKATKCMVSLAKNLMTNVGLYVSMYMQYMLNVAYSKKMSYSSSFCDEMCPRRLGGYGSSLSFSLRLEAQIWWKHHAATSRMCLWPGLHSPQKGGSISIKWNIQQWFHRCLAKSTSMAMVSWMMLTQTRTDALSSAFYLLCLCVCVPWTKP